MTLIFSIVGFLVIILSDSFQGRNLLGWRNKNFLLHSIAEDKIDHQNILLALPTSIIDDVKLTLYIKRWADELVEEGSAMKLQSIPTGVRFCFTSDLKNTLDVTVSKVHDLNVAVATHVETDANNEAIHSLINFAARNIIESISNNIGIMLTSNGELGGQQQNDKIMSHDSQGVHQITEVLSRADVLPPSTLPPVAELSETTVSKAAPPAATLDVLDIKSIDDFPRVILDIKDSEISSRALIKYIQTWSDKFAGRGTGVEADNCEDGIIFSFSLSDHFFLIVRVTSLVSTKGLVSHKVIAEMRRDGDGEAGTDTGASSSKLDDFVVRASKSLLKSLLQDLEAVYIPTYTTSATTTATVSSSQSKPSSTMPTALSPPPTIKDSSPTTMKLETILTEDRSFPSASTSTSTSTSFTAIPQTTDSGSSPQASPFTLTGTSGSMEFNTVERSLSYFEEINQELMTNHDEVRPLSDPHTEPSSSSTTTVTTSSASTPQPKKMTAPQSNAATSRKRDFQVDMKAKEIGLRLENFEGKGLEEQAAEELRAMMRSQKNNGLASYLKSLNASDILPPPSDMNTIQNTSSPVANTVSEDFFRAGSRISDDMRAMLERPYIIQEDLSLPVTKLPMDFAGTELQGGYDIFQGPLAEQSGATSIPPADSSIEREAARVAEEWTPPNPLELDSDLHKLDFLTNELLQADEIIHENILSGFKDLLLSDNFLYLMKRQNETCFDHSTRKLYYKMTTKSAELTAELGALVRTESVRHIQTIHDVCEVAVALQKNEDKFLLELDKIRPRFDTALLGYLEYAIGEEILSLTSKGIDASLHPSTWLQVLRVVQKGVFADFEYRYERLLEPLTMVFRFEDAALQSAVFERFINITPALDLPLLRELALNILKGLDSSGSGSSSNRSDEPYDPSLAPKIAQLRVDIDRLLSEEVIDEKLKDIEREAKRQGKTMERGYSNPVMQAELEARRLQERESGFEKEGPGLVSRSILESSESTARRSGEGLREDRDDGEGDSQDDRLSGEGGGNTEEELVPTPRGRGKYLLGWG